MGRIADRGDELPRYRQIADEYAKKILGGVYKKGDRLPSEAALAKEKSVAVGTIKRAYAELEGRELIYKVRGGGSYVRLEREEDRLLHREPDELIEETFWRLRETGLRMNELFSVVCEAVHECYTEERKLAAALVDCNMETMHEVMRNLEREIPYMEVEPYLLDELLSGKTVIGSRCSVALVAQKHYSDFIRYADSIRLKTEEVALRESRETIARLTVIPDWQEIRVIYRSREFLESVQYTLKCLGKKNKLRCIQERQITEDDEAYYGGKTPFVIPADYREYGNARMLQVIGHAEKIGSLIIPFKFEIDKGSLLHLKRVLELVRAKELEMEL